MYAWNIALPGLSDVALETPLLSCSSRALCRVCVAIYQSFFRDRSATIECEVTARLSTGCVPIRAAWRWFNSSCFNTFSHTQFVSLNNNTWSLLWEFHIFIIQNEASAIARYRLYFTCAYRWCACRYENALDTYRSLIGLDKVMRQMHFEKQKEEFYTPMQ